MEENSVRQDIVMVLNVKFANLVIQKEVSQSKLKNLDLKRFKNHQNNNNN